MSKQASNKITIISFVCSYLVIMIHTYNLDTYGINEHCSGIAMLTWWVETKLTGIRAVAVPFFFLISGYLFFASFSFTRICIQQKYISRFKSLVVPYIIWCTIYYFYFFLLTNIPFISRHINTDTVELSFSQWGSSLWIDQYYTLWFLKNLIVYIVFSPLLFLLLKNWMRFLGLIPLILITLASAVPSISIPDGLWMYMLGAYLGINHKDIVSYRNKFLSRFCVILTILLLFICSSCEIFGNDLILPIIFISVWLALDLLPIPEKLPWWMSITFFTYVFHDIILELIEKLIIKAFGLNSIFALIDYVVAPFITFCFVVITAKMLKRSKTIWNLLNGFR